MGAFILSAVFLKGETGRYIFLVFGICLAFAAVYEYLKMLEKINLPSYPRLTASLASFILGAAVLKVPEDLLFLVLTAAVTAGWFRIIIASDKEKDIRKNTASSSALFFLVFPLTFLAFIYNADTANVSGRIYFLFMLMVTKFGDTGAYTFGTISSRIMPGGNHKILPRISPKKSCEGTLV
jgi:phosphatidate cytidylyltransferase